MGTRHLDGRSPVRLTRSLADSYRRQTGADPKKWEATHRQMVLYDLAADMELGFFLAYYRNFAIPSRMAKSLSAP